MSDKTEPLRHVDKTRQDRQPVSERQRVKDWHKRIANMRNVNRAQRVNDVIAAEMSTPEFAAALDAITHLED